MPTCPRCGREHEELEPAFRRPDAIFAVPAEERPDRVRESDDLTAIDDEVFFLRAVLPIPVHGRAENYNWGFWARVARPDFEEYLRYYDDDPPLDHGGFRGTLANQAAGLMPTLGLPVHVHLNQGRARPSLMLLDDAHPLSRQQAGGVSEDVVHEWSLRRSDHAPPDRPAVPRLATLEDDGWTVLDPAEVGRRAVALDAPPPSGLVKASFRYFAANERGDVEKRIEHMWVDVDVVREDGWWGGTLDNEPFVPGPIGYRSRVWFRATHVSDADSAPTPGPPVSPRRKRRSPRARTASPRRRRR